MCVCVSTLCQIIDFIRSRSHLIESLCLCNTEGFWGDEGEYLSLNNKHNFHASHLGFAMGMLRDSLKVRCCAAHCCC